MMTGTLTVRMGERPILPVTIDTMLNFDKDADGVGAYKQTFRTSSHPLQVSYCKGKTSEHLLVSITQKGSEIQNSKIHTVNI